MMARRKKPELSRQALQVLKNSGPLFLAPLLKGEYRLIDEIYLSETQNRRTQLLLDLANMRDVAGVRPFSLAWLRRGIRLEYSKDLIQLRDELRGFWSHPFLPKAEAILDGWLSWRPSAEMLADYAALQCNKPGAVTPSDYMPFFCSLKAGKLIPDAHSLRAMLVQGVFENWEHFRYCSNADCATPYFIAKRKDQTVCNADVCKAEKQRQHALKWWNANRTNKARAKEKPTNTVLKEGKKNGTRKAR